MSASNSSVWMSSRYKSALSVGSREGEGRNAHDYSIKCPGAGDLDELIFQDTKCPIDQLTMT